MKTRQIIIIVVAILILVLARVASNIIGEPQERPKPQPKEKVNTVFVDTVRLTTIPIIVESTGRLEALNRVELFAEVQGVMLPDGGRFKAGHSFRKGDVLISLRSDDQRAQVISSRSIFLQTLSSVMADIRLDYPDEADTWQNYLREADARNGIPDLPKSISEGLDAFLTGRGLLSSYYTVRNSEAMLSKYTLRAPFNGVLTRADVDPGTVVRPGSSLGIFLQPTVYELEAAVDLNTAQRLNKGQSVQLSLSDTEQSWTGGISRVNSALDPKTQLCSFFTRVSGEGLQDGMYLQAKVEARKAENAFSVSRATLLDGNALFTVHEGKLRRQKIEVLHIQDGKAIIGGLEEGSIVLEQVPPDAYEGMNVEIYSKNKAS